MGYTVVTRQEWDARNPTRVVPLTLSRVDKFIVHYSGAVRTQTVRSIQNYCMDVKGHSDIDYNYLVRDGYLYIGRGHNEGSHTKDNNATSYGVCVIGLDGDANDLDFEAIRTLYDELCAKVGRTLRYMGHNQAPGASTSCPGSEIQTWINQGMPYPEEDMALTNLEHTALLNIEHYLQSIIGMTPEAVGISDTQNLSNVANQLTTMLVDIQSKVAVGGSGGVGISEDRLRQIIREEIAKTRLS